MSDIPARRLRAQRLTGKPFGSAVDAVRWPGAVQAQDYAGAKWALGLRTGPSTTEAVLDRLIDEGVILRTHVLRPTWHLVLPEDIRWLLDLTAPRIRRGLAARHRELELDENVFARATAAFSAALTGGRHLTRAELGEVLRAAGIPPDGQRLAHLLMGAELDGLVVSGPRQGRQFTYALLEERVSKGRPLDRAEELAELARRFFRSHGPAQLQDFAWWSGLTAADARTGIALAGAALEQEAVEGKTHWFDPTAGSATPTATVAHLLPNFDEYTVGHRDRAALLDPDRRFEPALFSSGSFFLLSNVVTVGGRVRGAWRRSVTRGGVRVEVRPLDRLQPAEAAAVEEAALRLGRFLERPVQLAWI
ncbi:MAG: winged helix DNA-binding domain-containing protein [Candidatus Dormibacteraceae bacterium]